MFKIRSMMLTLLLMSSSVSVADESWRITFNDTHPHEAIELLGEAFNLKVVNPSASCLKNHVTFGADKSWAKTESLHLISTVARLAGCDAVIYEGDAIVLQGAIVGA